MQCDVPKNASGEYVSTPALATDMLWYAKAEQKAAGKPEEEAKNVVLCPQITPYQGSERQVT